MLPFYRWGELEAQVVKGWTEVAQAEDVEASFPIVIHTVKGFSIVNKAEIDIFLEPSCILDDPAEVGNLISGSSAFSKPA